MRRAGRALPPLLLLWAHGAAALCMSSVPPPVVLEPQTSVPSPAFLEALVLERGEHYAVLNKPPSIPCHALEYKSKDAPTPLLQLGRDALQERINLVHRLDRGASGCVLCAFERDGPAPTTALHTALGGATKTYVALVRGEGLIGGEDLKHKGWFTVDREIKDARGRVNDATTLFKFVCSSEEPRASLVLARPATGRWHQIRRHLNGLSHPILGDTTHGSSHTNREWRERGMPPERIGLHLARIQLPATEHSPPIDVRCPLPEDLLRLLREQLPDVLEQARDVLREEANLEFD